MPNRGIGSISNRAMKLRSSDVDVSGGRGRYVRSQSYGLIPLDFLITGDDHPCPYLPGKTACEDAFWAEDFPAELYHDFMDHGFRRSGLIFYRPACDGCIECVPLRVVVGDFKPTKSQRRVLNKNQDVDVRIGPLKFTKDKLRIYAEYLAAQHGCSDNSSEEELTRFLYRSPVRTVEFEYRLGRSLIAAGVADLCSRSLSSVYVYSDPDHSARSLGTFSALQEIFFCRERSIPHHYLGFYVAHCPSMNYKARFKPCETLSPEGHRR